MFRGAPGLRQPQDEATVGEVLSDELSVTTVN